RAAGRPRLRLRRGHDGTARRRDRDGAPSRAEAVHLDGPVAARHLARGPVAERRADRGGAGRARHGHRAAPLAGPLAEDSSPRPRKAPLATMAATTDHAREIPGARIAT